MRLVIFGSRHITLLPVLERCMKQLSFPVSDITEIISGGARGADTLAIQYAEILDIPCRVFHANWGKHGYSAGPIRNAEMAAYADYGVALWDGKSRGTKHMCSLMKNRCDIFIVTTVLKPIQWALWVKYVYMNALRKAVTESQVADDDETENFAARLKNAAKTKNDK